MLNGVRNSCKLWKNIRINQGLKQHSKTFYYNQVKHYYSPGYLQLRPLKVHSMLNTTGKPHLCQFSTESKYSQEADPIKTTQNGPKEVTEPLSRAEKLKKAVKEYGSTVIVFHVGISLMSLGTCYLLVSAGLDITAVFSAVGLNDWASNSQLVAGAGTFAVAYAVHKVFAPMRVAITLGSVPFIVRYLRKIGFLKK